MSEMSALKAAYSDRWIDDEVLWLDMLGDRNRTAHVYDQAVADAIGARLPGHLVALQRLAERVRALG